MRDEAGRVRAACRSTVQLAPSGSFQPLAWLVSRPRSSEPFSVKDGFWWQSGHSLKVIRTALPESLLKRRRAV
jgi:hypothetical protein